MKLNFENLQEFKNVTTENGTNVTLVEMVSAEVYRASVSDNKTRGIVSVNGVQSLHPLDIEQIKRWATNGKRPKFHKNALNNEFYQECKEVTETETESKKPRQISENVAKKKNLCAVSYFETSANIVFLEAEAKHFEDALNLIADYKKRYGFSENRGATGNAFCALPTYKKYLANKLHAAHRWEQYQKAHENRINTLRQNFESARTEAGEYTRVHASELAKREVLRKVQELSKTANEAEEKLGREQNRVFLTVEDVSKMYGL